MANTHIAVFHHTTDGVPPYMVTCLSPDCTFQLARGLMDPEVYRTMFNVHAIQYEPGHAPNIDIEYEISAWCSVCPDGGMIETNDCDSVTCTDCGTWWNMNGEHGETYEA